MTRFSHNRRNESSPFPLIGRNFRQITRGNLLPLSDADLLLELQQRGYDISQLLQQKRKQAVKTAKVVSIDAIRSSHQI